MGRDLLDLFSMNKWRCSWSLAATIASVLALVSVVHLVSFPLIPTLNNFKIAQDSCIPANVSAEFPSNRDQEQPAVDFKLQFPADLHGAVVYQGAPWKAEIGHWLAGCDSVIKEVNITEVAITAKMTAAVREFVIENWDSADVFMVILVTGDGCTEQLQLECNYEGSPDQPFGRWVVSICPTNCDKTRAMCFCGEGTKYPNRPLAETCGFQFIPPSEPDGPKLVNWTQIDQDVFTTNGSKRGWCNVDPADAYSGKAKIKEECDCKYDGLWGRLCEVPVESVCINQCSRHGHCRGGFCQCDNGWYGVDCSMPSVISSITEWPSWLRPARIDIVDDARANGKMINLNAVVAKKRPLIYVYDLPPEFNSLLLEGRHFKLECVNRIYDDKNVTLWTDQLYGAQMALYESLLASPHRTLNGEEADFFFVPVLDSCIITRADDAPHLSMQEHMGLRSSLTLEYYKKAYTHIVEQYPYWNHSSGRDHIWFFSWDEGACYAPKEIWNSMMLVHWGNTNSKHNHSTTAYWADNWDKISSNRRGIHPCFDPDKDLVLPAWKVPDANVLTSKLWARSHEERKTLFYFNGNLGPAYTNGRPEDSYSMGIRQKLAEEFGSSPNKDGVLGKQHAKDVIVTPERSENYHLALASSVFCGVFPGDGWSGRMEDSILQGCIPVVIQDGIFLPYENMLNYDSFAVRLSEEEIPNLIKILRGFNETEIKFKLENVKKIWQRFVYRDSVLLEAERQKYAFGHVDDWAIEFLKLTEDDVSATLMQILHYKLHNDPWRKQVRHNKQFGLPHQCLVSTS
ncbi:glucuronoxylan glucuronosyltransferase [Vigna angularis]|uniref:Glucuronoxylan glucuronosyltransferase n=1 Tax=Phaseolus angularis TaxID=3914 RepID=A0A8T0KUN1_PHAAN|nr:glucuronoxylan glucuronosyltransferase [Vigna angularis]